jgi:hypothetical protein
MDIHLDPQVLARNAAKEFARQCMARSRDLHPIWDDVVGVLRHNEEQVFAAEGAVSGEPKWHELSDKPIRFHRGTFQAGRSPSTGKRLTLTYKRAMGYRTWKRLTHPQKKIMELTGKLKKQATEDGGGAKIHPYRRKLVYTLDYPDFSGVPDRPRSARDRITGDMSGALDSGRPGRPYNRRGRGGQYPMEPRTIFRITQASADEMADLVVNHITGTTP